MERREFIKGVFGAVVVGVAAPAVTAKPAVQYPFVRLVVVQGNKLPDLPLNTKTGAALWKFQEVVQVNGFELHTRHGKRFQKFRYDCYFRPGDSLNVTPN